MKIDMELAGVILTLVSSVGIVATLIVGLRGSRPGWLLASFLLTLLAVVGELLMAEYWYALVMVAWAMLSFFQFVHVQERLYVDEEQERISRQYRPVWMDRSPDHGDKSLNDLDRGVKIRPAGYHRPEAVHERTQELPEYPYVAH